MKQFSLLAVFAESFRLARRHWMLFLIFGVVATVLSYIFPTLILDGKLFSGTLLNDVLVDGESITLPSWVGGIVLGVLAAFYIVMAMVWLKVALNLFDKKQWSNKMLLSVRQWVHLIALMLIYGVIAFVLVGLGGGMSIALLGMDAIVAKFVGLLLAALCIIAMVYVIAKYYFAAQYIVDKKAGVIQALMNSGRITRHYIMRIVLLIATIFVVIFLTELIAVMFSLATYSLGVVVGTILNVVALSVFIAVDAIAYRQLDK